MIYSVLVLAPFENYLILQPDLVGETERLTAEKSFKQVSEAYAQLSGSKSLTDTDQEGRVKSGFYGIKEARTPSYHPCQQSFNGAEEAHIS